MLEKHFIEKLLGLQDTEIKNVERSEEKSIITIRLKREAQKCPCCGQYTDRIHDYRRQVVKDVPTFGVKTELILEKRRYVCSCGKRFAEENKFLPRYHRMTLRLILYVMELLKQVCSFTDVAKQTKLSVSTVIRIFDSAGIKKPDTPQIISIDEFKGNTGGEKYNCILTDPAAHRILDILPSRHSKELSAYFKHFEHRDQVRIFISDMWKPYEDIAKTFFKNAVFVVDKYHWIRQVFWAFERVRKDVQKKFQKEHRVYFKHSKKLLFKRFEFLEEHQKQQIMVMLSLSADLSSAYFLKERFLAILDCQNRNAAKKMLIDWIEQASHSNIPSFTNCANTMFNWFSGILNSFYTHHTNGFTEGCNNKIKVLKRNAFGYRNFARFRKRILYIFS